MALMSLSEVLFIRLLEALDLGSTPALCDQPYMGIFVLDMCVLCVSGYVH